MLTAMVSEDGWPYWLLPDLHPSGELLGWGRTQGSSWKSWGSLWSDAYHPCQFENRRRWGRAEWTLREEQQRRGEGGKAWETWFQVGLAQLSWLQTVLWEHSSLSPACWWWESTGETSLCVLCTPNFHISVLSSSSILSSWGEFQAMVAQWEEFKPWKHQCAE